MSAQQPDPYAEWGGYQGWYEAVQKPEYGQVMTELMQVRTPEEHNEWLDKWGEL